MTAAKQPRKECSGLFLVRVRHVLRSTGLFIASGMAFLVVVVILVVMMTAGKPGLVGVPVRACALSGEGGLHRRHAGLVVTQESAFNRGVARRKRLLDLLGQTFHLGRELLARGEAGVSLGERCASGSGDARREDSENGAPGEKDRPGGEKTELNDRQRHNPLPLGAPRRRF